MPRFGFYQSEHKNNNFYAFVQKQVWEVPFKKALSWVSPAEYDRWNADEDHKLSLQSITYRQLGQLVGRLAQGLLERGIKESDHVYIDLPPSVQYFSTILAVQKIAAIPVLIDQAQSLSEHLELLKKERPGAIITATNRGSTEQLKALKSLTRCFILGHKNDSFKDVCTLEKLYKHKFEAETAPAVQETTALINYIGSGDDVIGVIKSFKNLAAQTYNYQKLFEGKKYRTLSFYPSLTLTGLSLGHENHIIYPAAMDRPNFLSSYMKAAKIEALCCPKAVLTRQSESIFEYAQLKQIVSGRPALNCNLATTYKLKLPTIKFDFIFSRPEVDFISSLSLEELLNYYQRCQTDSRARQLIPLGKLAPNVNIKILRPTNEEIIIDDFMDWQKYELPKEDTENLGQLIVAAEHVSIAYHHHETQNKNKKITDDFSITWHRCINNCKVDEQDRVWLRP